MTSMNLKKAFSRCLALGGMEDLTADKRFAMQIAVLDGYWSIVAFLIYILWSIFENQVQMFQVYSLCLILMFVGLYLIYKKTYDIGRYVIFLGGLFAIFCGNDVFGQKSGMEYYYFVSIMMPFITFTLNEILKAICLSSIAFSLCFYQQIYGTGRFLFPLAPNEGDRILAIGFVSFFVISVLTVVRWKLYHAQKELQDQQKEVVHSMNKIALGEMAGKVAHEINNPLQSLSLQMIVMKEKYDRNDFHDHFNKMDIMIQRMAVMVEGLRDLSRKEADHSADDFLFSEILDDVLAISSSRISKSGAKLSITGDTLLRAKGQPIQISQIVVNLLNNSIDAISKLEEKWIRIDVTQKNSFLQVSVTDSGKGIPEEIVAKLMEPYFTTKTDGQGTGLGLAISKALAEKNHGKLYYDSASEQTRFVLLLPLVL